MDFKQKYLDTLRIAEKIRSNPNATAEDLAHADWLLETCRGDEISRRIGIVYPINAQMALNMNLIKDIMAGTKEHYAEGRAYEEYREKVKNDVDTEIAILENNK